MMRHNNNTMSCHSIIYMNLLFLFKNKDLQEKKNVFTSLCSDVSLFFFFPIDRVQKSYSLQLFLSLSLSWILL